MKKNKTLLYMILFAIIILVVLSINHIKVNNGVGENSYFNSDIYTIPILGDINSKNISLPFLSIIIGSIDGFNPCAMWILVFLISMLVGMDNKKKMWILGLTFILTSGLIYLLFMISWLNLAHFINKILFIRLIISIFSIIFGMTNLYKFINQDNKDLGCDITTKNKRKKISVMIKNIITEKKFLLAILGIMLLAASVNILELMCSLGLPVVFTQILSINNLNSIQYTSYIILYIIFFLLDDIIIFIIAMKTFSIKGISSKYSKYSHLFGGLIMILLGVLMIMKPEWLMFNF